MGKFYLYRGTKLVSQGECPDGQEALQAIDGLEYGLGTPPPHIQPEIIEPAPTYEDRRRWEYPPVGDQLDALWKLFGATAPQGSDARRIYEQVLAVKAKHPKT